MHLNAKMILILQQNFFSTTTLNMKWREYNFNDIYNWTIKNKFVLIFFGLFAEDPFQREVII